MGERGVNGERDFSRPAGSELRHAGTLREDALHVLNLVLQLCGSFDGTHIEPHEGLPGKLLGLKRNGDEVLRRGGRVRRREREGKRKGEPCYLFHGKICFVLP